MADSSLLVLHIGMPKVGSSSIQTSLVRSRKVLKRQGIVWPDEAQERGGHYDYLAKAALGRISPRYLKAFGRFLERRDESTVAVSSELLWNLDSQMIPLIRERVGDRRVRIAIYVRPYQDWLRSKFMQHARARRGAADFDTFFDLSAGAASIKAVIARWADLFGRDALHIRHVEALADKDVVSDFMQLAGAEDWQTVHENTSPHWTVCELARSMLLHEPQEGELYEKKATNRQFRDELNVATGRLGIPAARYLTIAQWLELDIRYRSEAEWLHEFAGVPLPHFADPPTEERPFLPDVSEAPDAFFDLLNQQLAGSAVLDENPYLAETIRRVMIAAGRPPAA